MEYRYKTHREAITTIKMYADIKRRESGIHNIRKLIRKENN